MDMDNICFICMTEMDDSDSIALDCSHKFHTECIELTIQNKPQTYYNNTITPNQCPYCRTTINIKCITPNIKPIYGIHYTNTNCCKEVIINGKNKNKICDKKIYKENKCKYHYSNRQCEGFYKSGKNKGSRCCVLTKNIYPDGKYYCGRHKPIKN